MPFTWYCILLVILNQLHTWTVHCALLDVNAPCQILLYTMYTFFQYEFFLINLYYSFHEVSAFYWIFNIIIDSGCTVLKCLELISKTVQNKSFYKISSWQEIFDHLEDIPNHLFIINNITYSSLSAVLYYFHNIHEQTYHDLLILDNLFSTQKLALYFVWPVLWLYYKSYWHKYFRQSDIFLQQESPICHGNFIQQPSSTYPKYFDWYSPHYRWTQQHTSVQFS